jgi:hypothetical protein
VEDGEVRAFLGVLSHDEEEQSYGWIQNSILNEAPDRIGGQTWRVSNDV